MTAILGKTFHLLPRLLPFYPMKNLKFLLKKALIALGALVLLVILFAGSSVRI
jgi:hypothetical protein